VIRRSASLIAVTAELALDLAVPADQLTAALVDIASVSGDEDILMTAIEQAIRLASAGADGLAGLSVMRDGNVVIARTDRGLSERIVLAGHVDTVPIADNLPSRVADGRLYGCGTSDMKSGVALQLRMAHLIATGALRPSRDVTWLFYDCEEIEADRNGLNRIAAHTPELLQGDLAILLEPTNGVVEAGCQGSLRVAVTVPGTRAHSARSWLGVNAIHEAAPVLARLAAYRAESVDVDGLTYREGLNAVFIRGGVAGNVIPDECIVTVNYRFAPDKTLDAAEAHVRGVFEGYDLAILDRAPAARPGLNTAIAAQAVAALGGRVEAKLGWTDVARFSELGIPALNFGPGDPNLAHQAGEYVDLAVLAAAEPALVAFLSG